MNHWNSISKKTSCASILFTDFFVKIPHHLRCDKNTEITITDISKSLHILLISPTRRYMVCLWVKVVRHKPDMVCLWVKVVRHRPDMVCLWVKVVRHRPDMVCLWVKVVRHRPDSGWELPLGLPRFCSEIVPREDLLQVWLATAAGSDVLHRLSDARHFQILPPGNIK